MLLITYTKAVISKLRNKILKLHNYKLNFKLSFTDQTLIRSEEGPKGLAAPLTAYMAKAMFSLPVAVDTLGGYNWRHRGDF